MILLIATICAAAMAEPCEYHRLGQFKTMAQCETVAQVHRQVLGHADNYKLECKPTKDGEA